MGYIVVASAFVLTAAVFFALTALRRREPDEDSLSLPSLDEMPEEIRKNHLFSCYLAGNDAYPSTYCPFEECTPERLEWMAGWTLAARGMMVGSRETRKK